MKNFFSKFALIAGILSSAFTMNAQTLMSSNNMIGTNTLLIGRYSVSSVSVLCATGAVTVLFYDSSSGITYSNDSYRYQGSYVTNNMPVIFTNALGYTNTNYYSGVYQYWVTQAAATSTIPAFASIAVEANVPVTLPTSWYVAKGLTINVRGSTGGPGTAQLTVLYK